MNTFTFLQQALKELNGKDMLGREVRLDFAAERGAYTPHSGYCKPPIVFKFVDSAD